MKRYLPFLLLASLSGCSSLAGFIADKGNRYCDVRPDAADAVVADINQTLAGAGAKFEVNGLTCLPD